MSPKLYASLAQTMQDWMEKMAEEDELPVATFWGTETHVLMAAVASAVLDAVVNAQETAIEQGCLREVE